MAIEFTGEFIAKFVGSEAICSTHQEDKSLLKLPASSNILLMLVTFETFQLPTFWLKTVASLNIPRITVTLEVDQEFMS